MKKYWIVNQLDNNTAEILIYGAIGTYENAISASEFVKELKALEKINSKIDIRINSNGGSVYEGIAIFNAIRNCTCVTNGYIDGIAASMASLIAMACTKVYMSKFARLMTHLPSGGAWGNADELRAVAEEIDALEAIANKMYQEKTGLSEAEVSAKFLNGRDNYFGAIEAEKAKLIDGIYDGVEAAVPTNMGTKSMWMLYSKKLQSELTNRGGIKNSATDNSITEDTNFEDLSQSQRSKLWDDNRALFGFLFLLEYGYLLPRIERPDETAIDELLTAYRKNKLPGLRKMSYTALRKAGYLNRLSNLDLAAYNKALQSDDEDYNNEAATANLKRENSPTAAINTAGVTDRSNFSDLTIAQKNALYEKDRSLFNAIHFLHFGNFPRHTEMQDVSNANARLVKIRKAELVDLTSQGWKTLQKNNQLIRLSHLDHAAYMRLMQE